MTTLHPVQVLMLQECSYGCQQTHALLKHLWMKQMIKKYQKGKKDANVAPSVYNGFFIVMNIFQWLNANAV